MVGLLASLLAQCIQLSSLLLNYRFYPLMIHQDFFSVMMFGQCAIYSYVLDLITSNQGGCKNSHKPERSIIHCLLDRVCGRRKKERRLGKM